MKKKNLLAILLIVCMLLTAFVACGKKDDDKKDDPGTPSTKPSETVTDPTDDGGDEEELTEVNMWMPDMGSGGAYGSKWDIVEAAINEYTIENLNIQVNFTWVAIADLPTQFSLASANNENVDIVVTTPVQAGAFLTYYANGACLDIAPYLAEYGTGIIELMDDLQLLNAFTMSDGGIYGLPSFRTLNTNLYFVYRTDMLEKVGWGDKFYEMQTWTDFEELLQALTDEGSMYAIGGRGGFGFGGGYFFGEENVYDSYLYDTLGDSSQFIYTTQTGEASNLFENEDTVNWLKRFVTWKDAGYTYPDSAFTQELSESLIATNNFAGYVVSSEFGVEINKSQSCSNEMSCLEIVPGMLSTASCNKFAVMVPSTSANPAMAVKLLNAFYTTPELMNMIDWGVEGETYVINDDGTAGYPEGTDSSNCGYHILDFVFGNQFLTTPWQGSQGGADFRKLAQENFLACSSSAYMGLTVDVSAVDSLVAVLVAIREEYVPQLYTGHYSDSLYNEFMTKLDAAGMDDYVAHFQAAIDGFMA